MVGAEAVPFALGKRLDDLTTLARNPLLAALSIAELGILFDLLDEIAAPAGCVVIREGDAGEDAYFVLEGEARARRGPVDLRTLHAGDHFGELALLGKRPRERSVEAMTALRLARLPRARFVSLVERKPALTVHVLTALAASLGTELASMMDSVGMLMRPRTAPRRAEVRIRRADRFEVVATGTPIGALLAPPGGDGPPGGSDGDSGGPMIVAGLLSARPVSLDTPVASDASVEAITMASWEGREIYRRSVGLLLLEAAHRVAPDAGVRLGPSIGPAQVVHATDPDQEDLARRLTRAMGTLIEERALFREELWTVEEAATLFADRGWHDARALLATWRDATVSLVSCGEVYAIRGGPVLPSAAGLLDVGVLSRPSGLLLDFGPRVRAFLPRDHGVPVDPTEAEARAPRFGGTMEGQHRRWLESLGVTSVGDFNAMCVSGQVGQLIRISEGFHEKNIGLVADAIARAPRGKVRVIAIAGPSSSGKTTFIKRLSVQLEVAGTHPVELSLDDYYRDAAKAAPGAPAVDLEALEAFDTALFRSHVQRALAGEAVKTARYDFRAHKSEPEGGPTLTLGPRDVLLVEGIHGLNPALWDAAVDDAALFRIFVHAGTTLPFDRLSSVAREDIRLLRRIVRDRHGRGYTAAENIERWPSVRRGEEVHIYPHLAEADAVFDASLVYEPAVLKVFAERYLLEVPDDHPACTTAHRLRHLVDRFVAIYPDHVPPTSVLREFIGGSGFEY